MNRNAVSFRQKFLRWFCLILSLMIVVAVGTAFYVSRLLNRVNFVDPETTPTLSQQQLDDYLAAEPTDSTHPTAPELAPEEVDFGVPETLIGSKDILHVLLIGQDRQEGETRARSDSMILCTFNKQERTLTMTSFLRDLYVRIPGYRDNRLNAAYAAGGMKLTTQTLEKNFGVTIHGCVEIDFDRFAELIDLLGGVTITLRQDEADFINHSTSGKLTQGSALLNGKQALAYARIRKLDADGDFSRTSRQRRLLEALLSAYREASLPQLLSLLEKAIPMVTTDLTRDELLDLAIQLFPILRELDIRSQHIPAEGTYSHKTIRGMAVLVADMEQARKLLEETIGMDEK